MSHKSVVQVAPGKTETWTVDETGLVTIRTEQDVSPILDLNAAEADVLPSMYGHAAWRKVASIPDILAAQWAKECGAQAGTKEFLAYAKKKVLDGEYAKLRVKGF